MVGKKKVIIGIITAIILIYAAFVTIDSIRLSKAKTGTAPLITISKTENVNEAAGAGLIEYNGLGYSIKYHYDIEQTDEEELIDMTGYGAEFWLFGRILIWGWTE